MKLLSNKRKVERLAIIVPIFYAIMQSVYHILGEYWAYNFTQVYTKFSQFIFHAGLLYIVSYFLPNIKKPYRIGFISYFLFLFLYKSIMAFTTWVIFNKLFNCIFWVSITIALLIFSVYLFKKDNKDDLYLKN
jgi:hypothetical protein